jgi:hypothetical protein
VNDQDLLTCAAQAGAWLLDRRERLEKHEHESTALLWQSVSEIAAIIDSFDALEAIHGLTLDDRVLRDDLIDWIEVAMSANPRDARRAVRPPAAVDVDTRPTGRAATAPSRRVPGRPEVRRERAPA